MHKTSIWEAEKKKKKRVRKFQFQLLCPWKIEKGFNGHIYLSCYRFNFIIILTLKFHKLPICQLVI